LLAAKWANIVMWQGARARSVQYDELLTGQVLSLQRVDLQHQDDVSVLCQDISATANCSAPAALLRADDDTVTNNNNDDVGRQRRFTRRSTLHALTDTSTSETMDFNTADDVLKVFIMFLV